MICVVVGDRSVGKTSLLIRYTNSSHTFPTGYIPTIFDGCYAPEVTVGETIIQLGLWDTPAHDEYERLRRISYPNADIFLICFSTIDPASYKNVLTKWCPELREDAPKVPLILVGTKIDQRDVEEIVNILKKKNTLPISHSQGVKLMKEISAVKYVECSAVSAGNGGPLQLVAPEALAREPSPEEAAALVEETQSMMRCLSQLHRTILELTLQGLTVDEVAERAECSERTVERALKLARDQLQNRLKDV